MTTTITNTTNNSNNNMTNIYYYKYNLILILATCLEYGSALMLNCIDGASGIKSRLAPITSATKPLLKQQVKQAVLTYLLPLLPSAMEIIGKHKSYVIHW